MSRGGKPVETYQMQMVNDALLSPLLLQMAVFSAIDATERTVGASSVRITGEVEFQNASAPIRLDNMFAADNGSAMQASLSAAIPVAYVMQSGFDSLQLKKVALHLEAFDQKKQLTIDGVTVVEARSARRREASAQRHLRRRERRGDRRARWTTRCPIGAEPGTLYFTVADANTANITDFRQILTRQSAHHRPIDLHGQQSAPEHQGLRARLAHRSRRSSSRAPICPTRRLRRADPGRVAIRRSPASRRRAIPRSPKWRSTRATWSSPAPKPSRWK